jgi:hypothetical protein
MSKKIMFSILDTILHVGYVVIGLMIFGLVIKLMGG